MSMKSWFASLRRPARTTVARRRQRLPLCVEALEERSLLSSNLIISSAGVFPGFNLVNPGTGGAFGTQVVTLNTGNIVVTDPAANNNAGAVYLFNGQSGALISTLAGSTGGANGDQVGLGGAITLGNGNFVVVSPDWSGGATNGLGAVTWVNGTTGLAGTVSASNSLVGTTAGDSVGSGGVKALGNTGDYVVASPGWDDRWGAATWAGSAGISGTISSTNSLVGATAGDAVASGGVTVLTNSNYVVVSDQWNGHAGAATWGDGTKGVTGLVSETNSLVGGGGDIGVGTGGVTALSSGNYVVDSPSWNAGNPNLANLGAVTFGDGTTGTAGVVSAANSLVGTLYGDSVGGGGVTALSNGNYVVDSPAWNSGQFTSSVGAATWASGTTGITGNITGANSLVGLHSGDAVGSGGVTALINNGNYVVASPSATVVELGGTTVATGAATWGDGTAGVTGNISLNNSLVGSADGDKVASGGVTALSNGNYVVASPDWSGGPANGLGAATWGSGASGIAGNISASNSLVGTTAGDFVGSRSVTPLNNGGYVVDSPAWNGGLTNGMGAATLGNGVTGTDGTISAANSLVGSTAGDLVGSGGVTALSNGNFVVDSPSWNADRGAVTFGSSFGASGAVAATNSLVGSTAGDLVGSGGVTTLTNGQYAVVSPAWNGNTGAATWVSAAGATLDGQSTINSQNSIAGAAIGANPNTIQTGIGAYTGSFFAAFPAENGGRVTIGLPNPNLLKLNTAAGQTLTVTPGFVAAPLTTIDLTLEAASTITVNSPIVSPAGAGNGDDLTLTDTNLVLNADIDLEGGDLTLSGTVSPGGSNTAIIHLSGDPVEFAPNSTLAIQLNGTTAGTGFDQLQTTGATPEDFIALNNVTLNVANAGGFAIGQSFVIVTSAQPITTTFVGLPEASTFSAGGQVFKISYLNNQVTLTVVAAVAISPSSLPAGAVGTAYSQQLTASGGTAPYTFALTSGTLPAGLGISSAGLISGTPTSTGSSTFTITATDANGVTDAQAYTVAIVAIAIAPTSLPAGTVGNNYFQSLSASGGTGPYTFAVTAGSLPDGIQLDPLNVAIDGVPTTAGTAQFTITATDANGATGSQAYTLIVNVSPIAITPATLPGGSVGVSYSQTLSASGGTGPYSFAVNSLDFTPGLTLSSTGAITGTPTSAGHFTFTIFATDANGVTGGQKYTMSINHVIAITPTSLPAGTVGASYSQTLSASGGQAPYSFAVTTGSLPAGLSLASSTGALTGAPTAAGTSTFTITATDGFFDAGSQTYTVTVTAVAITPTSLPAGTIGTSYSQTLSATGGTGPYTFAMTTGSLPAGLSLASSTGAITGQPTTAGSSTFTITATDANNATGSQTYTVAVSAPLAITTTTLATYWTATTAGYNQTIATTGGVAPVSFAVTTGSLPAGLTLNPSTGAITGTPTTAGTSTFTVTATDATSATASKSYTVVIIPSEFAYNSTTQTVVITLTAAQPNFTYSQSTEAVADMDFGAQETSYTFTLSGTGAPTVMSFANNTTLFSAPVLTNSPATGTSSVTVIGQGRAGTAVLSTNDTYLVVLPGEPGFRAETPERISLGSKTDAGVGSIMKFVGDNVSGAEYSFMSLSKFPVSYAYAGRADGTITLYGTQGTGAVGFVTAGYYSYVSAATTGAYAHFGEGAPDVYGYSAGNAGDFAYHYSMNAGSAFVVSGTAFSYMSGSQANPEDSGATDTFFNVAAGFVLNTGVSNNPGKDFAYIIDSAGNDTYVGVAGYSYMYTANPAGDFTEFDAAFAFAIYNAQSFVGGTDTANKSTAPASNVFAGKWTFT